MQLFSTLAEHGHESVTVLTDRASGLRALVAQNDSRLGPVLAPLKVWPYAADADAFRDVLHRARALTAKASLAGTDLGGGAITLVANPGEGDAEAAVRSLGRHVESHGGRLIVTDEPGTEADTLAFLARETSHIAVLTEEERAEWTALGAFHGLRACLRRALGHDDLGRASYAVQGAGQVGQRLVRRLRATGATVWVSDLNDARTEALVASTGAQAVPMQQIFDLPATVFCPCAMSGVLNEDTIPRLGAKVVAGTANDALKNQRSAELLADRGIVYAPDLAINAGDLIALSLTREGASRSAIEAAVGRTERTLEHVFAHAERARLLPTAAAHALARARIEALHAAVPSIGRHR